MSMKRQRHEALGIYRLPQNAPKGLCPISFPKAVATDPLLMIWSGCCTITHFQVACSFFSQTSIGILVGRSILICSVLAVSERKYHVKDKTQDKQED